MKVLFTAMRWDYGDRRRGSSFEYTNLYDAMRRMDGFDVRFHDFMTDHERGGPQQVRAGLLEAVEGFDPDLLFAVLHRDQVPGDLLAELRDRPRPFTFSWFCDDHWRFEDHTSVYAPLFNACSTTARSALPKYAAMGYDAVIKTQWGCNHHLYRPTGRPPRFDVTFVGMPHGDRRAVIARLRDAGIEVHTWGHGWPEGRLDQDEMVAVFAESRINLNLSNASVRAPWWRPWARRRGYEDQIKGRNFEIPGAGGFQLSGDADDLASYFEPGREIALFGDEDELVEQIGRYLADERARSSVAEAGHRRTLAEHTYERRFLDIFAQLDLPAG